MSEGKCLHKYVYQTSNLPLSEFLAMVWNKGKNIEGTIVMGHNLFCPPLQHNGS